MIYREVLDKTVTTCNIPDAVPCDRKIPIRAIHAFLRFLSLYIYHIHNDVYSRNIGTKGTESQSSTGFEGVPDFCSWLIPDLLGTHFRLFQFQAVAVGTSPEQSTNTVMIDGRGAGMV